MDYQISGTFIEACDCFDLCPCWVNDAADQGHCTGLVAWSIQKGAIDGVSVAKCRVVAVTAHGARRRGGPSADSVLFIDVGDSVHTSDEDRASCRKALRSMFSGRPADEAGDGAVDARIALGTVTGTVRDCVPATVTVTEKKSDWRIEVVVPGAEDPAVEVEGTELVFDEGEKALTLNHTALHEELQIRGATTAQRSTALTLYVPWLRSGVIDVTARSGMRGRFDYSSAG